VVNLALAEMLSSIWNIFGSIKIWQCLFCLQQQSTAGAILSLG